VSTASPSHAAPDVEEDIVLKQPREVPEEPEESPSKWETEPDDVPVYVPDDVPPPQSEPVRSFALT
jgi:hypothetical protein